MTRPLPAITLCLSALCGPAFAQTVDTRPTTPGNPTARAYGPTSGGVAWQRSSDDRLVVGYEITRDGTVLGVRDTLSYVADDLEPGRGYNFAIVAVDSAGQRSGRALARIETPDARPNRPSGLSANVYSPTAAGITWERSGVFGERYEVKRDGEIVAAATNGTSYIDTTLSAQRPYLFEVIAVNRQGQRSTAARLFVDTRDGSGTPPPPVASGPVAPSGLRSVIYSSTAGAIAWDRSTDAALRYEVSRDGQAVSTTNGTSYVDDTLTGGQSYAYAVVAIDRQGERSSPSIVSLVTPPGGATDPVPPSSPDTTISVENREEILANVLEVISGEVYRDAFALVDDVLFGRGGRTTVSQEPNSSGGTDSVVACDEGGQIENTSTRTGQSVNNGVGVDNCQIEGIVFDGSVQTSSGRSSDRTVENLTITRPNGETVLLEGERSNEDVTVGIFRRIDISNFETAVPDGAVSIRNARSEAYAILNPGSTEAQSATFTAQVRAPWTDGEELEIRTEELFDIALPPGIDSEEESYTSGILVAEAADGSRLVLDAGNGDPGSFTLTIEVNGGTSSFTVEVNDDVRIPCVDVSGFGGVEASRACELDLGDR